MTTQLTTNASGSTIKQRLSAVNKTFVPMTLSDLRSVPVLPPLTDEIPAASLAVVFGASGSQKTFYVLDTQVLPMARKGLRVTLVAAEGQPVDLANRIDAYCTYYGVDPASIQANLQFLMMPVYLMDFEHVVKFGETIEAFSPHLIVLDTLAVCSLGADENQAKDMGKLVDTCRRIIFATGASVLLVHHTGKNKSDERGSSAIRGQADVMISIARDDDLLKVDCGKARGSKEFPSYYLRSIPVTIRNELPNEQPVECNSLVLIPSTRVPQTPADALTSSQIKVLEALNLDIFWEPGAKSTTIIGSTTLPDQTVYKALSQLKRLNLITQSQKGDPYFITQLGKDKLSELS